MAAAVARRDVGRRALPLEQALRVHEVPRPAVADAARRWSWPWPGATTRTVDVLEQHGWRIRDASDVSGRPRHLSRVHRRLARRVHGREGPERPLAQRLVQRPQRHVSRRRAARGHAGHGLRQRAPDRAGPVRLFDAGRGGGGRRRHQRRLPERTHARPASSRAPISIRISCSRDCSRTAASRRVSSCNGPANRSEGDQVMAHRKAPLGTTRRRAPTVWGAEPVVRELAETHDTAPATDAGASAAQPNASTPGTAISKQVVDGAVRKLDRLTARSCSG